MLSLRMGRLEREGGVRCGSEDFLAMGLGSESSDGPVWRKRMGRVVATRPLSFQR